MMSNSLTIVGAGSSACPCAWRAAEAGVAVTVLDPAPTSGASWVAGGMLAPVTEAWPGEEELLELGVAAVRRWPTFAAELEVAAGQPAGLRTDGTIVAATGSGDRAELDSLAGFLARLGRDVERLSGRELRRLEPALGPDVRGGLLVPGDLAVDNRVLLAALRAAAERAGVRVVERAVRAVLDDGVRVTGVRTDSGEVEAEAVLVAAGAHSAALHPALTAWCGRSRARSCGSRTVRGRSRRRGARCGHSWTAARSMPSHATMAGSSSVPPRRSWASTPRSRSAESATCCATPSGSCPASPSTRWWRARRGCGPGSPDNLPLVGPLGPDGLLVATGHHRNGMLLAPVTADAVLALLRGDPVPDPVRAADPARLSLARR